MSRTFADNGYELFRCGIVAPTGVGNRSICVYPYLPNMWGRVPGMVAVGQVLNGLKLLPQGGKPSVSGCQVRLDSLEIRNHDANPKTWLGLKCD